MSGVGELLSWQAKPWEGACFGGRLNSSMGWDFFFPVLLHPLPSPQIQTDHGLCLSAFSSMQTERKMIYLLTSAPWSRHSFTQMAWTRQVRGAVRHCQGEQSWLGVSQSPGLTPRPDLLASLHWANPLGQL